jgi:hypothetical protein
MQPVHAAAVHTKFSTSIRIQLYNTLLVTVLLLNLCYCMKNGSEERLKKAIFA